MTQHKGINIGNTHLRKAPLHDPKANRRRDITAHLLWQHRFVDSKQQMSQQKLCRFGEIQADETVRGCLVFSSIFWHWLGTASLPKDLNDMTVECTFGMVKGLLPILVSRVDLCS